MVFPEIATILLLILKVTHQINVSWWVVFSPEVITLVFGPLLVLWLIGAVVKAENR